MDNSVVIICVLIVLAIMWVIVMKKLHGGLNKIFCSIPEPEEKMMRGFCREIDKIAMERNTSVSEQNFEMIKMIYNETEDRKISYLFDKMFRKYLFPVCYSFGVFSILRAADENGISILQIIYSIDESIVAILIILFAFAKMMCEHDLMSDKEIFRRNVTVDMWKKYKVEHQEEENILISNQKRSLIVLWNMEKRCLFVSLFTVINLAEIVIMIFPKILNYVYGWYLVGISIVVLTIIIVGIHYMYNKNRKENLWDKIKRLYFIKDEELCVNKLREEIQNYNNTDGSQQIVMHNIRVVEASLASEKSIIILVPLMTTVLTWFMGSGRTSLLAVLPDQIGGLVHLFLVIIGTTLVLISVRHYPRVVFVEKVIEGMKEEWNDTKK